MHSNTKKRFLIAICLLLVSEIVLFNCAVSDQNGSIIKIPVVVRNSENTEVHAVFEFDISRSDLDLDSSVMKFCEKYSILKNSCYLLMEKCLQALMNSSTSSFMNEYKSDFRDFRSDDAALAERMNEFRGKSQDPRDHSNQKAWSDYDVEAELDDIIYRFYASRVSTANLSYKSVCFIHSCTLNNQDSSILIEILDKLNHSNLMKRLEMIIVINYGYEIQILNQLQQSYPNVMFIQRSSDISRFEIPTMRHLFHFVQKVHTVPNMTHDIPPINPIHILYIHTKGVSYKERNQRIDDWRNMMLYYLIYKHETCYHLLASGEFDTLGCNFFLNPKHYSGNMWWATSTYLNTLKDLNPLSNKYDAEDWLLSSERNIRSYILHSSFINHYTEEYPPSKYISKVINHSNNDKKPSQCIAVLL